MSNEHEAGSRRYFLRAGALALTGGLAGCPGESGRPDDTETSAAPTATRQPTPSPTASPTATATETPTDSPTPTETPAPEGWESFQDSIELLEGAEGTQEAEEYATIVTSSEQSAEFIGLLDDVAELGDDPLLGTARSVLERGGIEDHDLETISRWLASDPNGFEDFTASALAAGYHDYSGSSADVEVPVGLAEYVGLDTTREYPQLNPVIGALSRNLDADGYTGEDIAYLKRLRVLADGDFENTDDVFTVDNTSNVSYWAQADALGLLEETARDGAITEDTLYRLEAVEGDVYLRGMKQRLGLDPEEKDSTGDSVPDGFWALTQFYTDFEHDPREMTSAIQVDRVNGASVEDYWERVQEEFPLQLQRNVTNTDLEQPETLDEYDNMSDENFETGDLGHFYVMVSENELVTENEIDLSSFISYEDLENGDPIRGWISPDDNDDHRDLGAWYAATFLTQMHGYFSREWRSNDPEEDTGIWNGDVNFYETEDWTIESQTTDEMAENDYAAAFRDFTGLNDKVYEGDEDFWGPFVEEYGQESDNESEGTETADSASGDDGAVGTLPGDSDDRGMSLSDVDIPDEYTEEGSYESGRLYTVEHSAFEGTPLDLGVIDGHPILYTEA